VVEGCGLATTEAAWSFGIPEFLLNNFSLDLQVGELISEALVIDSQLLSLLFSIPDFFF
jgi:hypothetical protein